MVQLHTKEMPNWALSISEALALIYLSSQIQPISTCVFWPTRNFHQVTRIFGRQTSLWISTDTEFYQEYSKKWRNWSLVNLTLKWWKGLQLLNSINLLCWPEEISVEFKEILYNYMLKLLSKYSLLSTCGLSSRVLVFKMKEDSKTKCKRTRKLSQVYFTYNFMGLPFNFSVQ